MQTKPKLLVTPEQLNGYWPQIEPLLAGSPVVEDMSPAEIKTAIAAGEMLAFVFELDEPTGPLVELVMVLAPGAKGYTIVTIAGKNLKDHLARFWDCFTGWCVMNGARAIDAYVPEWLEKTLEPLGLKRKSIHVRLTL